MSDINEEYGFSQEKSNEEDIPNANLENVIAEGSEADIHTPESEQYSNEAGNTGHPEAPAADSKSVIAAAAKKQSPFENSPYESKHSGESYIQPARKSSSGTARRIAAAAAAVCLVAGSCAITGGVVNSRWQKQNALLEEKLNQQISALQSQVNDLSTPAVNSPATTLVQGDQLTPAQVYQTNVDCVVAITCSVQSYYGSGTASGSGFVVTEDGYIVTNYHVVEDASSITVVTHSGDEYKATLIGNDSTNDVAVLKVDAQGLHPAKLGSSTALNVGDMVVAIGNPLSKLTATQTVGYVSGKDREITTDNKILNMLQTDVAINSGNSGGPLFNMQGEVVGITTAKYSGDSGTGASIEGISFAIPIDDISSVISDLTNLGYISGAYLGVTVQNVSEESAALYNLPTGAYVVTVTENSAAQKAGIQEKDIIIALGDTEVSTINELTRALRGYKAGDQTTITVIRSGERVTMNITLDEKPHDNGSANSGDVPDDTPEGDYNEWYEYFRKHNAG